jgi:hypothetical protein
MKDNLKTERVRQKRIKTLYNQSNQELICKYSD